MEAKPTVTSSRLLLLINCVMIAIGNCGGPLLLRLYFLHGGKRIWLSSWVQTGGWPVNFIPLVVAYFHRRRADPTSTTNIFFIKTELFIASAVIGVLTGLDDYLYAYGMARLPASTSSLIMASQLAFVAGFAFLLVKQKFTSYSTNAVILLTIGAAVLGMHTSGDRPGGESQKQYIIGFIMTLAAAALYGFVLPLVELMYKKSKQKITYTLVLEIQVIISFCATAFCTIGMIVNNDFKVIGMEAREFGLGESTYYILVVFSCIVWQGFFIGAVGVIFCGSSLLSGILLAALLPVTEVLAVIFFKESFTSEKGVSLALSLWGFFSYFYGEKKLEREQKKQTQDPETEMTTTLDP